MVRLEDPEIPLDYVNVPDRSQGLKRCSGATAAATERKLFRRAALSFGLLCMLQVVLNVSLRLAFYSRDSVAPEVEASCKNITERRHIDLDHYFQQGWVHFGLSLYYVSFVKKSWQESRKDCLQRGAHLVIIDSREEHDFTRKFSGMLWIGLTWQGKLKSYWGPGEPNNNGGQKEDCVQIRPNINGSSWNDIQCEDQYIWICEKTVA
ncbi:C-type lectin domain family 4 member F-like isoform X2 [Notolabrus celidotus]|uniref:C-type lectin domain family 4 member F-like isoform X2 n=1 Tax=Notolabrus celidotus TaxID=1203425 RepID=UPI00148FAB8A|nr:C-type lectin domain family 4 member F-like isoform X2 [Notolabrus celidotus]